MKLTWDSLHHPPHNQCALELGMVINFDTPEAGAANLRIITLFREKLPGITYGEEFVVVEIKRLENKPQNTHQYEIVLASYKDGFVDYSRKLEIGWPTELSRATKYLIKAPFLKIRFPKDNSEKIPLLQ